MFYFDNILLSIVKSIRIFNDVVILIDRIDVNDID